MADQEMLEAAISADDVADAFEVRVQPAPDSPLVTTKPGSNESAGSPLLHTEAPSGSIVVNDEDEEAKYNEETQDTNGRNPSSDNAVSNEEIKEEVKMDDGVIYRVFDTEQKIPSKVHGEGPDALNTVDPEWKYNITLGDLEFRRIEHEQSLVDNKAAGLKSAVEELWFPMERYPENYDPALGVVTGSKETTGGGKKGGNSGAKPPRKVFVALKVKRVSDVDNIKETFRMRFHIYFNWLMSEGEYRSYLDAKSKNALMKWEPKWYPHLEFQNSIEEVIHEWEVYPDEGRFRMQIFKDFGQDKKEKIPAGQFDCTKARFIRAKLECEMTFAEELELQSFPFDCQDLSCIIEERTTTGTKCIFLPELRKPKFGSIDPRYSVIDEWDLETAVLEFGDTSNAMSRSKSSYAMIVLRLKVKRRWKVFFANIVFLMACISLLGLTSFALTEQDLGDRLNLLITLILTAVAFGVIVTASLPNVPYLTYLDKYILCQYMFLVFLMGETALLQREGGEWGITPEGDGIVFVLACVWCVLFNVGFCAYGWYVRQDESQKLAMSSDEVEKEVCMSRPALLFNYLKRERVGDEGRLLSFTGMPEATKHMNEKEVKRLERNKTKMEQIHKKHGSMMGDEKSQSPR